MQEKMSDTQTKKLFVQQLVPTKLENIKDECIGLVNKSDVL